jgi:cytochrome c peroxidase
VKHWAFGAAAMLAAWAAPSNAGEAPLGLPPLPPGAVAPPERIELGRKLFFDRGLSFNNTLSCAMCHIPDQGFTSNQTATSVGLEGQTVRRNAPTLLNVVYRQRLFHDGRETGLSTQAWGPILNPLEMGNPSAGYVLEHVRMQPAYGTAFDSAFPGRGVSMDTVGDALAAYEATLLDGNTRFDRWHYGGQRDALTSREQEGFALFTGKAGCGQCHLIGPRHALFSDGNWHNTGIGYARTMIAGGPQVVELVPGLRTVVSRAQLATIQAPQANDLGRFEVTLNPEDRWAYMTPTLRAISRTAPYMHDGSLTSLTEVVEFYDRGGIDNPEKSALIRPLGLSEVEKAALVAFLQAL